MALDNVTSHFSTMLETIASASFLSSLSIIHGINYALLSQLISLTLFFPYTFYFTKLLNYFLHNPLRIAFATCGLCMNLFL